MARLGQHPRARPEVSTHPSQKARLLGSGQIKVMIDHQLGQSSAKIHEMQESHI